MRFGRKNKTRTLLGRRTSEKAKRKQAEMRPVASEERSALLFNQEDRGQGASSVSAERGNAEPTQRLLTILGRFQRYVHQAEQGAPQATWSDPCMDQLIAGTEVAVSQGWSSVTEALTGTARILQSYEDVQRGNECAPFMARSYEVLCLMVGDLIVDNVRSGVLERWLGLYRDALEQLEAAGIPLVDDSSGVDTEEIQQSHAPASAVDDVAEHPRIDELPPLSEALEGGLSAQKTAPDETTTGVPSSDESTAAAEPLLRESLDEPEDVTHDYEELLKSFAEHRSKETQAHDASSEITNLLDSICDQLGAMEKGASEGREDRVDGIEEGLATLKAYACEQNADAASELCTRMAQLCDEAVSFAGVLPDTFFELAYGFTGLYVEVAQDPQSPSLKNWNREVNDLIATWHTPTPETSDDHDEAAFSPFEPLTDGQEDALYASAPVTAAQPATESESAPPEDETLERDQAPTLEEPFRTPVEPLDLDAAKELDEDSSVETPPGKVGDQDEVAVSVSESGTDAPADIGSPLEVPAEDKLTVIGEDARPDPTAETPPDAGVEEEQAAAPEVRPPSLSDLFETTRAAFERGDVGNAKLLALQLAADIAREEAQRADQQVQAAETHLNQEQGAIESARARVREMEEAVARSEQVVCDGEGLLKQASEVVAETAADLERQRQHVADLDEQIRELQRQRDESQQQLEETEVRLDERRATEEQSREAVDNRREQERKARLDLEDARQKVKQLNQRRVDLENHLDRAREVLTSRRMSLVDIEQTISQIKGSESDAALDPDDLLF